MKCEICLEEAPEYSEDTFQTSIEGDLLWVHVRCLKEAIKAAATRHYWEMKLLRGEIRAIP